MVDQLEDSGGGYGECRYYITPKTMVVVKSSASLVIMQVRRLPGVLWISRRIVPAHISCDDSISPQSQKHCTQTGDPLDGHKEP